MFCPSSRTCNRNGRLVARTPCHEGKRNQAVYCQWPQVQERYRNSFLWIKWEDRRIDQCPLVSSRTSLAISKRRTPNMHSIHLSCLLTRVVTTNDNCLKERWGAATNTVDEHGLFWICTHKDVGKDWKGMRCKGAAKYKDKKLCLPANGVGSP